MSAPDTNITKQTRWHKGPIIGISLVLIFALGLLFYWLYGVRESGVAAHPDNAQETQPAPSTTP